MLRSAIILMLFLIYCCVYSQQITGIVADKQTNKPVPYAGILLLPSQNATACDSSGNFSIQAFLQDDSIYISSTGYVTLKLALDNLPQNQKFYLTAENYNLNEFVVSANFDAAKVIMKKVIQNKKQNDPAQIDAYKKEVYNKVEIGLSDYQSYFDSSKVLKDLSFILNYVDSTIYTKPVLPVFFTESISDYYYRRQPEKQKEIIKATKTSVADNENINQFSGSFYQKYNLYDNYLFLFEKKFVSPIADVWNIYYKMEVTDTLIIDNKRYFTLQFSPRLKQENVFTGTMLIADSSFAVKQINMEMNQNANINFLQHVFFTEEFNKINDSMWMLTKDILTGELKLSKGTAGLVGRKTTFYRNFAFNNSQTDSILRLPEDVFLAENATAQDEYYWMQQRPEPLTEKEQNIYAMLDSVKNLPVINNFIKVYNTIVFGNLDLNWIKIGPYFNVISFNSVEGYRARVGIKTGEFISKDFIAGIYGAYGFKDRTFKYGGSFDYVFDRKRWQKIGINYQNDLDVNTNNTASDFGEDNFLSGLYRRNTVPQKLTHLNQFDFYYKRDFISGFSGQITFTHAITDPYFDYHFTEPGEDANYPDSIINNSTITVGARFALHEKFINGNTTRISLGSKYPIFNFTYTQGIENIFRSDFIYQSLQLNITDAIHLANFGETRYSVTGGKTFGNLPSLLLHAPLGNETYFYSSNAFNLLNEYEFFADVYLEVMLSHHFDGFFLNKIPLMRKLKFRELIEAKAVVGTLTDNNKLINSYNSEYYLGNSAPFPKPYVEAGVGIENILKVFRVDAVWRVTYRNQPVAPNFLIMLGMQVQI